ncbi:hypothetical protein BCR39DRAFT_533045 [Naematelia encephala]|uniref:COP9 signalosome complex subunit 6 n=1 Tax=Naematelia encephala TaxID=71784 RepID=A0A1Y2B500_9TREE|nr:hypothetical protein BCR39DRAFT_533045 [Naematelia encephala]
MAESSGSRGHNSYAITSGATSGLKINLHPLPILNISDHQTRARLTTPDAPKLIGALLGTQTNREVSIVNSFELIYGGTANDGDVEMVESSAGAGSTSTWGKFSLNSEFLETRKDQFKQVFPALDIIGWYSVGSEPNADDVALHQQFTSLIDTPVFLLFDPTPSSAQEIAELPIKVYEAALAELGKESEAEGKFVELEFEIETGEAERIAVDGVSRGGIGSGGDENAIGSLTTQRNAIRMLYERVLVLLRYITAVMDKTSKPDHTVLRQIASLVATLPTIDAPEFKDELSTEYTDVQLTNYLSSLTKQLNALSDVGL